MLKNVITHPGTGTETVNEVLADLGARLHVVTSLKQARRTLDNCDGAILLGGTDISPAFYGETNTHSYRANRNRDAVEWLIARHCLGHRKPIFGICRGHQMLAVAAGGALYQDIYRQGATIRHPSRHELADIMGVLSEYLPSPLETVNSLHHQAVNAWPFGFSVLARSAHDGLIESIWRAGYLGVQWHPELMIDHDPRWISLFEWFVEGLR